MDRQKTSSSLLESDLLEKDIVVLSLRKCK